jgi:serine/threonine-protein kinase
VVNRLWLRPLERPRAAPVVRSEVDLTADRPLRSPAWRHNHPIRKELALSPDGTLLVWTSEPDDATTPSALYLRRLESGETTLIPGTEKASQPFFSPDGRWIGFVSYEGSGEHRLRKLAPRTHRLRKVPVEGGLAIDLAELPWSPKGMSWGADGRIFLGSTAGGIHWVPAEGGPLRELTTVDRTREADHQLPSALPGGQAILMTAMLHVYGARARIEIVSLMSGERKVVVEDGADARYLLTGHLAFVRRGVLMAAPFDLRRLELTGPPVPVVPGVNQALSGGGGHLNSAAAQFAVSDSGLLVYAPGGIFAPLPVDLLLVDETGRADPLPGFDRPLVSPQCRYSPDGRQLAFVEQDRNGLFWLFDLERQTYRALSDRGIAASPRWSPDGTRLVLGWSEAGPFQLWLAPTVRGDWERLTRGERDDWAPSWSPDGRFLAFVRGDPPVTDVFLCRFEDRQAVPFLATEADEMWPEFSPDGRWLAYGSNESGRFEVYVTSFPGRERTLTVSRQGGMAPAWARDGRRLFYYTPLSEEGRGSMMAVTVRHEPELSLGPPTVLFRLPDRFGSLVPMRSYELHPDGRRFLVGRATGTGAEWRQSAPSPA